MPRLRLLETHPRLLVFRSFSKAWGLAGLRCGYAIGSPGSEELLAELEPDLGVSEISQAGRSSRCAVARSCSKKRVRRVAKERESLTTALRQRGFEVTDSQANFSGWRIPRSTAASWRRAWPAPGIVVERRALGEPSHVRIAVHDEAASTRLLNAIDRAFV